MPGVVRPHAVTVNKDDKSFLSIGGFIFGAIALLFGGYALAVGPSDSGGSASSSVEASGTVVDISLSEFKMTPEMATVPPGDVTIRVTNNGTIAHNFSIPDRSLHTRDLQPGESQTISVKNVVAGELDFMCTIPAHADSGMKGMRLTASMARSRMASGPSMRMNHCGVAR